eukprot:12101795-Alexandrium_andersonii.AAC.1
MPPAPEADPGPRLGRATVPHAADPRRGRSTRCAGQHARPAHAKGGLVVVVAADLAVATVRC